MIIHYIYLQLTHSICIPAFFIRMVTNMEGIENVHKGIWTVVNRQAKDGYANKPILEWQGGYERERRTCRC